ncbi:hypothetical protein TTHERM_00641280 (macronuclear) [Tetrahymena thermophila SB210]|uniref:Uncharacterized protein n=1 Tax=Tetrahymena thermophila (strain SB210) TaxID=312017 RepID=Q23F05_TETTS|nr:hypothetical protein TTHERM_00641280 [Tetrahymena thermophila SB210]EAR95100.1 hypothetical protein TTHERM_00641280 [Tetrahymena thermophila SB210]|eukprot:XP_001015345.1 hypothetical protein TTHERM_00641280 [Tetrahymena thermophila SB210]
MKIINRSLQKNESISPRKTTKQNSQLSRLDISRAFKLKVESTNRNLNSSLSPKQEQSKTNILQQKLNQCRIQSPLNKVHDSNQFQFHQKSKIYGEKLNNIKKSQQAENQLNLSKHQSLIKYASTDYNKYQCQIEEQKLISGNKKSKTQDDNNLESDSDSEEVFSIWKENQLKSCGLDTDQFIDDRGQQLGFYQIYRLRSALYQPSYVSRLDTIQEVQILSQHFNKEIPIELLKQQQFYLDKYYEIQKKDKINNQILQKQLSNQNFKGFTQKCQTERLYRPTSSQEQNKITSTKLKQQISQQLNLNETNRIQKEKSNIIQNQSERMTKKMQNKQIQKQIGKKANDINQEYQHLSQQYKSKRRQKISIDQEEIQKFIQNQPITDKNIISQDGDEDTKIDQSFDNTSIISNNKHSLSKDNNNSTKIQNEEIIQNITETAKSVLSYLQKIVSNQTNQGQQLFQNNKFFNLTDKFMSYQSNKYENHKQRN